MAGKTPSKSTPSPGKKTTAAPNKPPAATNSPSSTFKATSLSEAATRTAAIAGGALLTKVVSNIDPSKGPLANARNLIGGGSMMFPSDLIDPSAGRNFYMSLTFMPYERRSIFNQPFLPEGDSIRLPIPNNLTDTQSVSYKQESAPVVGAGIESALGGGSAFNVAASTAAAGLADKAKSEAAGFGVSVDQLLQMKGVALNPFLTVLFEAPTFKDHTFQWRLNPSNVQESNTLKEIIKIIRANMLPGMVPSTGGTLLGYPSMLQINLFPDEEYLYRFKPAVVTQMSANFAPGNTPGFFKGSNAPTEIVLQLQVKEIEYWLSEDVTGTSRSQGMFNLSGLISGGR